MIFIEADTANAKKLQSPIITVQTLRHITAIIPVLHKVIYNEWVQFADTQNNYNASLLCYSQCTQRWKYHET